MPSDVEADSSPEQPRGKRLDSWKEIAAYLNRDVRTLFRWEAQEQLPVYRHLHQGRSTVYAHPTSDTSASIVRLADVSGQGTLQLPEYEV